VDVYPIGANSCESGSAVLASRFRFFFAENPVSFKLHVLDVNGLSPLAALNKLYESQQRVRE